MAETLFTQLPVATALTGDEVVPIDQPNAAPPGTFTTKRTTTGAIARSLSPTNAVQVSVQSGTTYAVTVDDRAKLLTFANALPITVTLPTTGNGSANATPSWFVQIENRGTADLTISPTGVTTIDGAASLVLTQDQGVLLAVGPDNNWYTQRGTGLTSLTAVTSVGLSLPASVFSVSGSPVTTTGTLTGTLITQAATLVWAGPVVGADAAPTFRGLEFTDLPSTAASSLIGNATGGAARPTPISIGATLTFVGSALQTVAGTGDVTWAANSYATTIAANAVTYAKFQQVAALSVVGNATNALANAGAITAATDGQVLRRSGTAIGFGALDLANANAITGALPAGNGGTGLTTYVIGDLIYASATTTLARLAGVATGNALISGGVGAAPSWGKIGLTTHVSGTLAVANGGTGIATATAYAVLCGGTTATGPFQSIASVGTSGQVLTSNGPGALPTFQAKGDVVGPAGATDNALARFDTATGKLVQNSGVIVDDSNNVTGIAALTASGAVSGGSAAGSMIATQTVQETATSTTTLVTPGRQHFHPSSAKAWVYFNGTGTIAINSDYGVASIADNGTGDTTVTFDTAFSSATAYSVGGFGSVTATVATGWFVTTVAAASFRGVSTRDDTGVAVDAQFCFLQFFGDL